MVSKAWVSKAWVSKAWLARPGLARPGLARPCRCAGSPGGRGHYARQAVVLGRGTQVP